MDSKNTKELRARLKRSSPPSGKLYLSQNNAKSLRRRSIAADAIASRSTRISISDSNDSDSENSNIDLAALKFKLAAELEAANPAQTSILSVNWQVMKAALMSSAHSEIKAIEEASMKASPVVVSSPTTEEPAVGFPTTTKIMNLTVREHDIKCLPHKNVIKIRMLSSGSNGSESNGNDITMEEESDNDELFVDSTPSCSKMSSLPSTELRTLDVCVIKAANPLSLLARLFDNVAYTPFNEEMVQRSPFLSKRNISLAQLSLREENVIKVEIKKSSIDEFTRGKLDRALNPLMDVANVAVKHADDEFFTVCTCRKCLEYRELVIPIMVDQFKAAHMVVMLLDVIIKAYGPMLKNETAYIKFERLLDGNRQVYWLTSGLLYDKRLAHIDFIYDETLSDNMIVVLASSILMVNNPMLLLQILSFHIECLVKAYTEGFLEFVEPGKIEIPADEMLTYILDGFDELCLISEELSIYLFAYEKYFLQHFSLTWSLLCQRLYYQHVFMSLNDTMLACMITLKDGELTPRRAKLIRKYIAFDEKMSSVDRSWKNVWIELNKFNMTAAEQKRREAQLAVYQLFDTVVQDAQTFALPENGFRPNAIDGDENDEDYDEHDFYDFEYLANRRLAWQNIMSYTKMKWPKGFFESPNTLVHADECRNCQMLLGYHEDNCKCITCSIAIGPWPPRRNADSMCSKCLAHTTLSEKENFNESKLLNTCTNDDFTSSIGSNKQNGHDSAATVVSTSGCFEFSETTSSSSVDNTSKQPPTLCETKAQNVVNNYHIAWAVFKHLSGRPRYLYTEIKASIFCTKNCAQIECRLARHLLHKDINISSAMAVQLIKCYQPLVMNKEELCAVLPNIMLYSLRMRVPVNDNATATSEMWSSAGPNGFVVTIFWIFVLSVYATNFMEMKNIEDENAPLMHFKLESEDIYLILNETENTLKSEKDECEFVQFLDRLLELIPLDSTTEDEFDFTAIEFQHKLDDFVDAYLRRPCKNTNVQIESLPAIISTNERTTVNETATSTMPRAIDHHSKIMLPTVKDAPPKRVHANNEKLKKCCFDHSGEFGDHCKENHHIGKKRSKKDCNHVRVNETRDRLRKKFTQMVNARKNVASEQNAGVDKAQARKAPPPPTEEETLQQPPQLLKSTSTPAAAPGPASSIAETKNECTGKNDNDDDSLECLNSLCKRFSNLQTGKKRSSSSVDAKTQPAQNAPSRSDVAEQHKCDIEIEAKRNTKTIPTTSVTVKPNTINRSNSVGASISTPRNSGVNAMETVREIYGINDGYSEEQSKVKKWIDETLNYIEGSTSIHNNSHGGSVSGHQHRSNSKSQPQPSNPKKAAKKAKQRLRKEEEKRIAELQDFRSQFQDIYFREFSDKWQLRQLLMSKKRDKRQIAELEANIKKLQRGKAKVQAEILELIATVKQTNSEFKFTYLPTKEQQQLRLNDLEAYCDDDMLPSTVVNGLCDEQKEPNPYGDIYITRLPADAPAAIGNSAISMKCNLPLFPTDSGDMVPSQFPVMPPASMCYAPPQQQQLPPNVMAAMAANSVTNTTDPSKRIVTIRRINLPNVPEPQVTVTAKGISPDKDTLLYTFVNGQLIQTDVTAAMVPLQSNLYRQRIVPDDSNGPSKPAAVFRPPQPPLTKTQRKKERRRMLAQQAEELARAEAEALAAAEAESQAIAKAEAVRVAMSNTVPAIVNQKKSKKQKQTKDKSNNNNILTSKTPAQKSSVVKAKNNALKKDSLISSMSPRGAACIAASETEEENVSITSRSSTLNTRENSTSARKSTTNVSAGVLQKQRGKQKQAVEKQPVSIIVSSGKQQAENCKNVKKTKCTQSISTVEPPAKSATITSTSTTNIPSSERNLKKRNKLIDQGQFDNNPFKTLNTQNSDSDWESSALSVASDEQNIESVINKSKSLTKTTTAANAEGAIPSGSLGNKTATTPLISKKQPGNADVSKSTKSQKSKVNKTTAAIKMSSGKESVASAESVTSITKSGKCKKATRIQQQRQETVVGKKQPPQIQNVLHGLATKATTAMGQQQQQQQQQQPPLSKRAQKQALHQQRLQQQRETDCYLSEVQQQQQHMTYFNAHETATVMQPALPAAYHLAQLQTQQQLKLNGVANAAINTSPHLASTAANVSIMDQLNRGVLVENLSLPPGITLTKVDPVKSEQLRQKSESIRRLSKPLQPPPGMATSSMPTAFHHNGAATIIAPPHPTSYYGHMPYAGVAAGTHDPSIIMVEAKPKAPTFNVAEAAAAATLGGIAGKTTKGKKRRNKGKATSGNQQAAASMNNSSAGQKGTARNKKQHNQTTGEESTVGAEMITLRNPMFHAGPASAAASILQQHHPAGNLLSMGGLRPVPGMTANNTAALPMDQPAAIIKNENGMFTIRNPALHQAVTSGLALGGYRQFGNVNYYTPQEAVAEVTKSTIEVNNENENKTVQIPPIASDSFSYFSSAPPSSLFTMDSQNNSSANDGTAQNDKISIIYKNQKQMTNGTGRGTQKCISAIGSEKKQKNREAAHHSVQWSNSNNVFPTMTPNGCHPNDNFLNGIVGSNLQENYQQSNYYNGTGAGNSFGVFTGAHSCGDESPPPIVTGFNSYLEGIPNTGVIRYDDATFLKNLIPGQQLNNEVTIHNVNEANFGRNTVHQSSTSPVTHQVEITPVYSDSGATSNIYKQHLKAPLQQHGNDQQQGHFLGNSIVNYRNDELTDYANDNIFGGNDILTLTDLRASSSSVDDHVTHLVDNNVPDNLHLLGQSCSIGDVFNYDFETVNGTTIRPPPPQSSSSVDSSAPSEAMIDLNNILLLNSQAGLKDYDSGIGDGIRQHSSNNNKGHSPRASPAFLNENTLEAFVQNMNALQLASTISVPNNDEQQLLLNGGIAIGVSNTDCISANNSARGSSVSGGSVAASSQSGSSSSCGVWW